MNTGTIKSVIMEKGFGFITPDDKSELPDGKNDFFFHNSGVVDGTIDQLREGDKVTFELDRSDVQRGPKAINVKKS